MDKEKTTYTKTEIKQRGWTDTMIKNLLPEPQLKPVPMHPSWGPMKLWDISLVEQVEGTEAFSKAMEKASKRKEAAEKAVVTKLVHNMEYIEESIKKIKVRKLRYAVVYTRMIEDRIYNHGYTGGNEEAEQRWAVNFVRHELTSYDKEMYNIAGKVGTHQMYAEYKRAVLDKIAEAYPELQAECERQKQRIEII